MQSINLLNMDDKSGLVCFEHLVNILDYFSGIYILVSNFFHLDKL